MNGDSNTISDNLCDLKLFVFDFSLLAESIDCNDWFIDLEVSIHMSCNKNWLKNFHEKDDGRKIYLGNNRSHDVKGCGYISVQLPNGHVKQLSNVMYVPRIKKNMISVSAITDQGLKVEFLKGGCQVKGYEKSK